MLSPKQKEWAQKKDKASLSKLSKLLRWSYRFRILRPLCRQASIKLEGGFFFSQTLRKLLVDHHGVDVGKYSYGPCLVPGLWPAGTRIGAYCSIANGVKTRRRNHPSERLSQHPFFYNAAIGLLGRDSIELEKDNPLEIGNDVWIGDNVLIMPKCKKIGNGAMIGAGSVVTKDVPPYTIVAGNPARRLADRYDEETIASLEKSRWWEFSLSELLATETPLLAPVSIDDLAPLMKLRERS